MRGLAVRSNERLIIESEKLWIKGLESERLESLRLRIERLGLDRL